MAPDLIEDLFAFLCVTQPEKRKAVTTCPACGALLEENEFGELSCPDCDN